MELVFFRMPSISSLPDLFVATDDAGSVGFGAIWGAAWFGGPWPSAWSLASITLLELFSLVVAAHVWAHRWHRLKVQFLGDNAADVGIINSDSFRDQRIMNLVRCLTLVAYRQHFSFSTRHIPGHRHAYPVFIFRSSTGFFHPPTHFPACLRRTCSTTSSSCVRSALFCVFGQQAAAVASL